MARSSIWGRWVAILWGLRFMGQRFVPDAFVFGQLIARKAPRDLPKALDFFAALGSDRALGHLAATGDTKLAGYQANMDKLRAQFASYGEDVWTQNLYWSWIHSLRPLLDPPGEGYPRFMRSEAWLDKQLKRDTILYAKQVYAEGRRSTAASVTTWNKRTPACSSGANMRT